MFTPKKTKYKKYQKKLTNNKIVKSICFKDVFTKKHLVVALESCRLSSNLLEMSRVNLKRHLKKTVKIIIPIFAHDPVTKKPNENRMGKGKGSVSHWIKKIKPGTVLFEFYGGSTSKITKVLSRLQYKFPIKYKYVRKNENY